MNKKYLIKISLAACFLATHSFGVNGAIISDDFNDGVINPDLWTTLQYGGPTVSEKDGKAYLNMPANSHGVGPGYTTTGTITPVDQFGSAFVTKNAYTGDFSITIDYSLLAWPAANGTRLGLFLDVPGQNASAQRVSLSPADYWSASPGQDVYLFGGNTFVGSTWPTMDSSGSLKLVREGEMVSGYYRSNAASDWISVGQILMGTGAAQVGFSIYSTEVFFAGKDIEVACDNFTMEYSGSAIPVPEPSTWLAGLGTLGTLVAGAKLRRQTR